MTFRRARLLVWGWGVTLLFFSACRPSPDQLGQGLVPRPPAFGDMFVSASLGDASRLNPLLATDSASGEICGLVFNGLVKYDKNLTLVGDLAAGWEMSDGGRQWVFHLKPGVRWHDGAPFTAADVVFTFEKLRDPSVKTPFRADYELVSSVTALDPLTVRVRYHTPFAPALESWGMGIIPKHLLSQGDFNTHPVHRHPVGTGIFRFDRWRTDEKIILSANPDAFEGRPFFDRYLFRVIPDQSVQFLELRQRSIDSMNLTPDQFRAYPEFFHAYNRFRYPAFSYLFFGFNLRNPLFSDHRVREALARGVDKGELIDGVFLGLGRPATGPFPPGSWAFDPTVPDTPYDPAGARKLLAEAGWRDSDGDAVLDKDGRPFAFTVLVNQGNKTRELTALILQSRWREIGVDMHVRVLEWSAFLHDYVDPRRFDALILGWNLSRDPDQWVIWHSSADVTGGYNFMGYHNPAADQLWDEGRLTFDPAKRQKIYHRLHAILQEDLPCLFLCYPESLPVVHRRIVGPEVAPAGLGWNFREWGVPRPLQKYVVTP